MVYFHVNLEKLWICVSFSIVLYILLHICYFNFYVMYYKDIIPISYHIYTIYDIFII